MRITESYRLTVSSTRLILLLIFSGAAITCVTHFYQVFLRIGSLWLFADLIVLAGLLYKCLTVLWKIACQTDTRGNLQEDSMQMVEEAELKDEFHKL